MDLSQHLLRIYTFSRLFGVIHFKFNKSTRKFERCLLQWVPNTVIICFINIFCGFIAFMFIYRRLLLYVFNEKVDIEPRHKAQERVFDQICFFLEFFSLYIYGSNYMNNRRAVMSIGNELLKIFRRLERLTSPSLYLNSVLVKVFTLKMIIVALQSTILFPKYIFQMTICFDVVSPYAFLLSVIQPMSYMYLQMVLICFYCKMNLSLKTFSAQNRTQRLEKFIRLSWRIHRVKRESDRFYSAVFLCTYLGLIFDIQQLYEISKVLLFSKYISKNTSPWTYLRRRSTLLSVTFTLDMYLINLLSDTLAMHEQQFQRRMFLLLQKDTHSLDMARCLDMMMLQSHVFGVGTLAFNRIKINRGCAFTIMLNIIICNVITFLQFYAGEEIYIKNPHLRHFNRI